MAAFFRIITLLGTAVGIGALFGGDGNTVFHFGDDVKGKKTDNGLLFVFITVAAICVAVWYFVIRKKKFSNK